MTGRIVYPPLPLRRRCPDKTDTPRNYRRRTRRGDDRRDVPTRLRSSTSDGEHDEVITAHGGSEWSGDRRGAEWRRVGGSARRPRHRGRAQLWGEGETRTGSWRGGAVGSLKGSRQETYDVIEVDLIIDAGEPGLIGGTRMRERDGNDDQKSQQHGAQAIGTRGVAVIESSHSRLVGDRSVYWSGGRHYGVGEVGCQDESYSRVAWRMRR
jgi:hypothetical protein